jgi:pSer/pThr/pTyr-binding forkhead associated (FHA) protein
MICVLRVVEGPATGMKCWLRKDQRLTIGRQSSTDFSIPADLHMSRNHLMVEGLASSFRVRDVGSSNGTYVNNFPISAIELCNGDRIKAGSTVFEVDLEIDAAVPLKESPSLEGEVFGFVPSRSLSMENPSSEQDTMRYTVGSLSEQPTEATQVPAEEALEKPIVEKPIVEKPTQPLSSERLASEPKASVESRVPIPSAFLAGFSRSEKSNLLWRQTAEAALWEPIRLIDCLLSAPSRSHLSLIINRSQLGAAQFATLDFDAKSGNYRALTESLYILQSHNHEAVLQFYKACLTKDAAVCIASEKPLSDFWLHDAIDILSYPSMLFELLSKSPERAQQLVRKVQFVMFEPNTQGELCLLHASE